VQVAESNTHILFSLDTFRTKLIITFLYNSARLAHFPFPHIIISCIIDRVGVYALPADTNSCGAQVTLPDQQFVTLWNKFALQKVGPGAGRAP
jgi:hypothetical protein